MRHVNDYLIGTFNASMPCPHGLPTPEPDGTWKVEVSEPNTMTVGAIERALIHHGLEIVAGR
jgi:hypothetical protein